jgi:hypothetical protein
MTGLGFELLGLLAEYKSTACSYTGLIGGIIFNVTICNNMLKLYGKCTLLRLYISLGHSIVCELQTLLLNVYITKYKKFM